MRRALALTLLVVLPAACRRPEGKAASGQVASPVAASPLDQARALLDGGDADGALAKLGEASDPASLCLQGLAWSKKAVLAPLPTPPPAPGGRGAAPPAPEFKPEELKAVESFERVLQTQPADGCANLGLADLLAPHSLRKYGATGPKPGAHNRRVAPAEAPDAGDPDYRSQRVLQAYRGAIQGDMSSRDPVDRMVDFALRVGSLDDADQGLQEMVRRDRENPEPLVHYGDFLLNQRKDPLAAIEQYRQALIWRADDPETKAKIADIYIGQAIEAYAKGHYAVADARLRDAQKYVTDPVSPQGLKIRDYMGKLNAIRQPAPR